MPMQIIIKYDSCWQNSFLEGHDNEPLPKNKIRKFIATSKATEKKESPISKDTVLGVLCRLIGEQRKLHEARIADDFYFKDFEEKITFNENPNLIESQETVAIINKSDARPAQSSFVGIIKDDTGLFFSDVAPLLWSVFYLDIDDLMAFILGKEFNNKKEISMPRDLRFRIDDISGMDSIKTHRRLLEDKEGEIKRVKTKLVEILDKLNHEQDEKKKTSLSKPIDSLNAKVSSLEKEYSEINQSENLIKFDEKLLACIEFLSKKFNEDYLKDGVTYPMKLYAAALYLQLERMKDKGFEINCLINKNGNIQGFSKCGFNGIRDFFNPLATGNGKRTVTTPYVITKASGQLEITIDIETQQAKELKRIIDEAAVSSFYLGKKGLAYVSNIRV